MSGRRLPPEESVPLMGEHGMGGQHRSHDPGKQGALLADTRSLPWYSLGEGISFQLLRFCEVTGRWALFVRMQPGSRILPHKHLSSGEFFVTKGELLYDVGSAPAGVYGYEAIGEIHEVARAEVETEYLFLGHGPVAYPDDRGGIAYVLDYEFLKSVADGNVKANVTLPLK